MDKKKILVVDDEPELLKALKIRLEASGYDVVTINNGKEALVMIKKEKPDAVLMDILMPEMDGLSTLEAIRKKDKDLPVFIITAFSNPERFKVADKLNASGFLVKTGDLKMEIDNITSALSISGKFKKKS